MPEDYLVKYGAKEMLATAIAEVLTLRPRVPVAFLASHFQGLATNKSAAVISRLRACHLSSPVFPSAVENAFYDLAATEAVPMASVSNSRRIDSQQRPSSSGQQNSSVVKKAKSGGPTTISEASFLQLLQHLSTDFPEALQTRLIEAVLSVSTKTNSKELKGVELARFHRGVQACLLMEELLDAGAMLFQALESSSSGTGVTSDALVGALRSSATSQFPRELTAVLMPLLARASTSTLSEATKASATMEAPALAGCHLLLQLSDIYDVLFDLALAPSGNK
ncbi:hypothetical protein V7S43_013739 [Phytophthora oleae]|uniref:RIIa domain-containing protein n=1 Tax=Phytophthora oleae TaxID=2107226 RepID=A0ABD3F528_9STRA